jgi:recombination protein U
MEAKSSRSKTSFPLNNIAPQQVTHLRAVKKMGGLAFFIINLYALNETYLLDAQYVCDFYEQKPRKSIPVEEIKAHGYLVKEGYRPRYDYLPLIDEHFLK